jgi:hypothetical protein
VNDFVLVYEKKSLDQLTDPLLHELKKQQRLKANLNILKAFEEN